VQCIELTNDDVARTGVLALGPFTETLFALRMAQSRSTPAFFGTWRARVRPALSARTRAVAPLFRPYGALDLATLVGPTRDHDEALAAVAATPAAALRAEVEFLADQQQLPGWTADLAGGDKRARLLLAAGLQDAYQVAVGPSWPQLRARVETDRAEHAGALSRGGVAALFAGLAPHVRWSAPVLELANHHTGPPVRLQGHGLFVVPTAFCTRPEHYRPLGGHGPSFVFVPALHDAADASQVFAPATEPGRALPALLGRTRAAVLELVAAAPGITTSELATRVRCSAASASEHVGVLRAGGLVYSERDGASVRHYARSLGLSLLDAAGGWVP
jgi:DNA-binding transcriptional ArsR family regulator